MSKVSSTEERVEHALAEIRNLLAKARALDVEDVEAIAEQLRVEAMLARTTRHRRRIYTALAEHYEHVASDRRAERTPHSDDGIGGAVRAIIENFEDDDEDGPRGRE